MTVSDKQLDRHNGWVAGIDNVSPEQGLTRDDHGRAVIALRAAENVDLLAGGKPRRRAGRTAAHTGTRIHSLWRDGQMAFALFVENGVLRGFYGPHDTFDIAGGIGIGSRELSYALVNDRVYWSDGFARGTVDMNGEAGLWGCPQPPRQPDVGVAPNGALHAGQYQVAITYATATGEESGTGRALTVQVPEGSGIALSNIPDPPPGVARVRVYVSQTDGDVLHHRSDLSPGLPVAVIGQGRHGKPLDTQFLEPMPAGAIVRWLNGRLLVATTELTPQGVRVGVITWSEALRYGLCHRANNRLGLRAPCGLLEPLGSGTEAAGVFACDDKRTYWFGGADPANWSQRIVYGCAAVKGTAARVDPSALGFESTGEAVYWMADNGVGLVGFPGGQIVPLRVGQTVAPKAASGASLWREANGTRQVVTALRGTSPRGLAFSDRMEVEVVRHDQDAC